MPQETAVEEREMSVESLEGEEEVKVGASQVRVDDKRRHNTLI